MSETRAFTVGETVHLRARVSTPGTRIPVDPDEVTLVSLQRAGTEILGGPMVFNKDAVGDYSLVLPTEGYVAGVYQLTVRYEDADPEKVVIDHDQFALLEP